MSAGLTPKQQAFIDAYLRTGEASASYVAAYGAGRMNAHTIACEANRLLKKPKIAAVIEEARQAIVDRGVVSAESLTQELLATAREARTSGEQLGAAVSAYRTVAQLHGLMVHKHAVVTGGLLVIQGLDDPDDTPTPRVTLEHDLFAREGKVGD
ncbi:MAG: terminase small subunit [Gammaproteobacteria bacterium]